MSGFFSANIWTMIIIASLCGCLIPIVAIITDHLRKARQAELDHELKSEMLAQGKSLQEIQEVLEMTSEQGPWWARQSN